MKGKHVDVDAARHTGQMLAHACGLAKSMRGVLAETKVTVSKAQKWEHEEMRKGRPATSRISEVVQAQFVIE